MGIKFRILAPTVILAVIIAAIISGTLYITLKEYSDDFALDQTSRLRTLSQVMAKDACILQHADEEPDEYEQAKTESYKALNLFAISLNSLINGGPAPEDMYAADKKKLPPSSGEIRTQLLTVQKIWKEFSPAMAEIIAGKNKHYEKVVAYSASLFTETDKAISMYQKQVEQRRASLLYMQIIAALLTFIGVVFFIRKTASDMCSPVNVLCRKIKEYDGSQPLRCSPTGTNDELEELARIIDETSEKLITDYTEIKKYSKTLEENIEERTRDLAEAKHSAEETGRTKSSFIANMSHELRTPMNAIIGFNQLLLKSGLSDREVDFVRKSQRSAVHLMSIINDILDFSKIEAQILETENVPFDLRGLLDNVFGLLSQKTEEKNLEFISEVAPDVPRYVTGDPLRLAQILLNLGSNAVKFTEHGHVRISVGLGSFDGKRAVVSFTVDDTGVGIKDEAKDRLISSFSHLNAATSRLYGGTGLGLAITAGLLRLMHGAITVDSEQGKGSCFAVGIPFDIDRENGKCASASDRILFMLSQSRPGEFRMNISALLVEDNRINQLVASELMHTAGIHTTVANNGLEAVEILSDPTKAMHYDIVFMDLRMPVMDGFEAARQIRRMPHCKDKVIIALTADAMADKREAAFDAGMNDFMTKPFSLDSLRMVICKWIPARNMSPESLFVDSHSTDISSFPEIYGIDTGKWLSIYIDDESQLMEVLKLFYDTYKDCDREMDELSASADTEKQLEYLHSLIGASLSCCAYRLHNSAKQLRDAVRQDDKSAVMKIYAEFSSEMNKIIGSLRNIFGS